MIRRAAIGILLFQDISIVFMLLAVPLLGGEDIVSFTSIVLDLGTSLFALVVLVVAAWFLLPTFLKQIEPCIASTSASWATPLSATLFVTPNPKVK